MYYLYENWTHDYVGIHEEDCNLCNKGKGMHSKPSIKNGIWIGPFKDQKEAEFVASKLKRKTILKCSRCL
ncbi:MAG: hypothetical protein UT17_C0003G0260 [Candidatus Woesebacteria bacterium GW2011_GWB1_39_10]|uniref:Uncharacterized protein n=2 Tax=Candidatus Woeseibacteriota TaxID=1752722 RepID=A0A0G0LMG7_9BACT|nr:MAG: hypothetical protein UT17_C0003G0260 [Candidatus Woesebacteria bacterium GW2011_GWB1_39_10]KKS91197.1 MAG: hypothetical protein UV66_C0001G0554 [Candidatus Woesebacteria bacterium GW2011_GWA1_43_12]